MSKNSSNILNCLSSLVLHPARYKLTVSLHLSPFLCLPMCPNWTAGWPPLHNSPRFEWPGHHTSLPPSGQTHTHRRDQLIVLQVFLLSGAEQRNVPLAGVSRTMTEAFSYTQLSLCKCLTINTHTHTPLFVCVWVFNHQTPWLSVRCSLELLTHSWLVRIKAPTFSTTCCHIFVLITELTGSHKNVPNMSKSSKVHAP